MSKPVTIYALIDPRDNEIRYIGQTVNTFGRYPNFVGSAGSNVNVHDWFVELRRQGLQPIFHSLEVVSTTEADDRERYYIQKALSEGCSLLNRKDNPFSNKDRITLPTGIRCRLNIVLSQINVERLERWERPLSVKDLARESGLSTGILYKLMNESADTIHFDTIARLCRVLNCDLNDLFW